MPRFMPPLLVVTSSAEGDRVTLAVRGEVDISTADLLVSAIAEAERLEPRLIVADATELDFMDVTGFRILLAAARRARARDAEFRLVNPHPGIARALHVTGIDATLDVEPRAAGVR